MYKHSLSRNQRSKGFKVKQVLQICVLVAVCFWLIYQVKHSHDKKKAFEENDANLSLETNSRSVNFGGRKNIQDPLHEKPLTTDKKDEEENGVEEDDSKHEENGEEDDSKHEENGEEDESEHEANVVEDDSKHEENEEDDDSKHEENEEEDDSKHEENEEEEDDSKHEENGEEDDNKHEDEQEHEEDNKNDENSDDRRGDGDDEIDEHEQEKSEIEIEHEVDVLDEERERESVNETEENENKDKGTKIEDAGVVEDHNHEAREEQYKGDDASSAVTHESESVSAENGKGTLENPLEKTEANSLEDGNVTANTDNIIVDQNRTGVVEEKSEIANVTVKEEEYEILSSKQEENLISNEASNQEEMGSDLAKMKRETNDTPLMNSTEAKQNAGEGEVNRKLSSNDTQSVSGSIYTQNLETKQGESLNSSTILGTDVSEKHKAEENTEQYQKENLQSEKETGESETDGGVLGHHDPIDESDSSISLEKDVRTDLDTLPDIRTEGSNDEEAAAE